MEDKKQDSYTNILAIIAKYRSAIDKKNETLVSHCARLEALEYLLPELQQLLSDWDNQSWEASRGLVVKILAQVRERTKRTALSLFENPSLPENQFIIDLAQWLESLDEKPAIEILCPDLSLDSAHQKYRDLQEIPLEELFGTFVESTHDGYAVPVKVLAEMDIVGTATLTLPDNYYYDFMKTVPEGSDTTKLSQADLKKLFEHSPEAEKLVQLQQEYWILQQQDPSLYSNINLFVKRLKNESVNERGSEFDTGAGAYQLIIDFFEYYDALSSEERQRVPAQVKEQLRLIHAYSSDPQMNVNALGQQEVQTCTATRSKALEKAIQSPENSSILKTIAISSQTHVRQLQAIEVEVQTLQKAIADTSYRGKPAPGQLAALIAREQWSFTDVFPEGSYVKSIHFLSPHDIRALFSTPQGLFAAELRQQIPHFFYNGDVIDIVLSLNNSQKAALCSSLKDLIEPGLMNSQKLSYLIELIGGDNLEKVLGTEIRAIISDAKNAIINQSASLDQKVPSLKHYFGLKAIFMQSNMSTELKKELEIPDEFFKTFLESNKDHFAKTLFQMAAWPLSRETLKQLIVHASSQPQFYEQLDYFYELIELFEKIQLDTEAKKAILQNFFNHTPPKSRNFYLGLPDETYKIILKEPELAALIPSAILDTISYSPCWNNWLKQDKELGYPMSRELISSLQAYCQFKKIAAQGYASEILRYAQPEKWPKKRPTLRELNLRDSFELCQLLEQPRIEKYIFSGKRGATFFKDALNFDKTTYSQPLRRLLMAPKGAAVLTHLNSFIKLRIVLSSVDPVLFQEIFNNLAKHHMDFLKNISCNEDDEKNILSWLKKTSLLYRLGVGFLEPIIGYVLGPTRVQEWEKHMMAQAAQRLSPQSSTNIPQEGEKEKTQEYDLGVSCQSAICFSQRKAPVRESLKNKK